jgi:hypothetical protein
MNRLFQIISGNVDRKNDERFTRGSKRRSVACVPGLEGMEERLSLSSFAVGWSGSVITGTARPVSVGK